MEITPTSLAIYCLVYLVVPGALLVRAFRYPSPPQLDAWADMYRLELSEQNRPVLLAYLRRSRRFRVVPAAIIWAVSGGSLLTGDPLPFGLDDSGLVLYAYFAGAALAVLTLPAYRPSNSTRVARLESRSINDYLAPHVRKLLWGTTALVLALLPTYAIVAEWARELPGPRIGDPVRPVGSMVPVVIVALAVALVSELAQRRVVTRAQPATSPDLVAADDAVRASSVALAAGGGLVVALGALATEIQAVAQLMTSDWLRWPLHVVALGALLLTVSSIVSAFRPEPWWFGRRHTERVAA